MLDYNARWYSPGLGRFTQPDSIVPEPGNSQAWNRYTYSSNNPINKFDPSGHADEDPGDPDGECTDSAECDLEEDTPICQSYYCHPQYCYDYDPYASYLEYSEDLYVGAPFENTPGALDEYSYQYFDIPSRNKLPFEYQYAEQSSGWAVALDLAIIGRNAFAPIDTNPPTNTTISIYYNMYQKEENSMEIEFNIVALQINNESGKNWDYVGGEFSPSFQTPNISSNNVQFGRTNVKNNSETNIGIHYKGTFPSIKIGFAWGGHQHHQLNYVSMSPFN